jgi:hypothetical protein
MSEINKFKGTLNGKKRWVQKTRLEVQKRDMEENKNKEKDEKVMCLCLIKHYTWKAYTTVQV